MWQNCETLEAAGLCGSQLVAVGSPEPVNAGSPTASSFLAIEKVPQCSCCRMKGHSAGWSSGSIVYSVFEVGV